MKAYKDKNCICLNVCETVVPLRQEFRGLLNKNILRGKRA